MSDTLPDTQSATPSQEKEDPRFTMGLYVDVIYVLEQHGYIRDTDPSAHARSIVELLHMVREFEGVRGTIRPLPANEGPVGKALKGMSK